MSAPICDPCGQAAATPLGCYTQFRCISSIFELPFFPSCDRRNRFVRPLHQPCPPCERRVRRPSSTCPSVAGPPCGPLQVYPPLPCVLCSPCTHLCTTLCVWTVLQIKACWPSMVKSAPGSRLLRPLPARQMTWLSLNCEQVGPLHQHPAGPSLNLTTGSSMPLLAWHLHRLFIISIDATVFVQCILQWPIYSTCSSVWPVTPCVSQLSCTGSSFAHPQAASQQVAIGAAQASPVIAGITSSHCGWRTSPRPRGLAPETSSLSVRDPHSFSCWPFQHWIPGVVSRVHAFHRNSGRRQKGPMWRWQARRPLVSQQGPIDLELPPTTAPVANIPRALGLMPADPSSMGTLPMALPLRSRPHFASLKVVQLP